MSALRVERNMYSPSSSATIFDGRTIVGRAWIADGAPLLKIEAVMTPVEMRAACDSVEEWAESLGQKTKKKGT